MKSLSEVENCYGSLNTATCSREPCRILLAEVKASECNCDKKIDTFRSNQLWKGRQNGLQSGTKLREGLLSGLTMNCVAWNCGRTQGTGSKIMDTYSG